MSIILQKTQIAAKAESVEGTAETLAAADAFLAFTGGDPDPSIEMNERNPFRGTLSSLSSLPGKRSGKFPVQVELAGSGVVGTAPAWSKLMKACAFGETVNNGVSVVYAPASATIPSLTLAAYMDGTIHKLWGARGNVKLALEVGKPGLLKFDFQGADFSHIDGALLVNPTYTAIVGPAFLGATFTLDGVAFWVEKVEFDIGNTLSLRTDPNSVSGNKSCLITARKGKITLDPEMVLASTKDIWTMWKDGTTGALSAVLGTTAGNIVTIAVPRFQLTDAKFGNRSGYRTTSLTALMAMNYGDDEISITLT